MTFTSSLKLNPFASPVCPATAGTSEDEMPAEVWDFKLFNVGSLDCFLWTLCLFVNCGSWASFFPKSPQRENFFEIFCPAFVDPSSADEILLFPLYDLLFRFVLCIWDGCPSANDADSGVWVAAFSLILGVSCLKENLRLICSRFYFSIGKMYAYVQDDIRDNLPSCK